MNATRTSIRIIDIQQDDPDKSFASGVMAKAIAEIMQTKGRCLPFDLIKRRFRPMEVSKNWNLAYALGALSLKAKSEACADA